MSGRAFDAQVVLTPVNSARGKILSQYVCARIVSMENVDVGHWKYDWHNSLFYFITNSDEYIYARYGGRDARSPDSYLNLKSLELALKAGLEQHELYQQGKLPKKKRAAPFYPRDLPDLKKFVVKQRSCVECHHIGDYRVQNLENSGKLNKIREMFPYPDIRNIGIELDVPKGLVVKSAAGPVADAGLKAGDLIASINGTKVLTFADFQFEYDQIDRQAQAFQMKVRRNQDLQVLNVKLPPLWWYYDVEWRFWSIDPLLYFESEPLSVNRRKELGLAKNNIACLVGEVAPIAKQSKLHQLQTGDIIVGVNGVTQHEFIRDAKLYIRLNVKPGDTAELLVIRGKQRLKLPIKTKRQYFRKQIPEDELEEEEN